MKYRFSLTVLLIAIAVLGVTFGLIQLFSLRQGDYDAWAVTNGRQQIWEFYKDDEIGLIVFGSPDDISKHVVFREYRTIKPHFVGVFSLDVHIKGIRKAPLDSVRVVRIDEDGTCTQWSMSREDVERSEYYPDYIDEFLGEVEKTRPDTTF